MNVKVISVYKATTKDGSVLYCYSCSLPDGSVGKIWSGTVYKLNDTISLEISVNKESKFVVRPRKQQIAV